MNRFNPIYTEKNDCQDCYKCLRQCPVKAIKVENASASIMGERCIYCGHCVQVCPVGAKKMRNDIQLLRDELAKRKSVIACLAPTYVSDFSYIPTQNLIGALQKLGFTMVSETALGASLVAKESLQWFEQCENGVYLSSCCPSVVDYVNKYFPHLSDNLSPYLSPMQAHARMLKKLYGDNQSIAFFGPCIAKKHEAESSKGLTNYALTFGELKQWLDEDLPGWENFNTTADAVFKPFPATRSNYFPIDGGMIATMKRNTLLTDSSFMSFSGIGHIREILNDIPLWNKNDKIFLELMACEGGCIKGPGTIDRSSAAIKRHRILQMVNSADDKINTLAISQKYNFTQPIIDQQFSETQINSALEATGKFTPADELNCGGCGYDNCRDFAQAMLIGNAERTMCITYMRRIGQGKASALLKKIPSAVVVADENLKIVDANARFAELLGSEIQQLYETTFSLEGADLRKIISFTKLFDSVLQSGEEMLEQHVRENGRYLNVSIVTIQPYKVVCGIIDDMREPEVRKDIVVDHTRQVIKQNMEVVQKIAFLLGENASFTESMLRSIIESHDNTEEAAI
jgi:iron only hydrogenase large subunit-like protein